MSWYIFGFILIRVILDSKKNNESNWFHNGVFLFLRKHFWGSKIASKVSYCLLIDWIVDAIYLYMRVYIRYFGIVRLLFIVNSPGEYWWGGKKLKNVNAPLTIIIIIRWICRIWKYIFDQRGKYLMWNVVYNIDYCNCQ